MPSPLAESRLQMEFGEIQDTQNDIATSEDNSSNDEVIENASDGSTTDDAQTKAFLTVKFNHEDMNLDEENAKALAQKGLAYDSLKEKYDSHSKGLTFLESYSKKLNMSVDELVDHLAEQDREMEISRFQEDNNILDANIAKKLYESNKLAEEYKEQQRKEQEEKQKNEQAVKEIAELEEFSKTYLGKEFKLEDLPQEVIDDSIKSKISPANAWAKYLLRTQHEKANIQNLNNKNSATALGSIKNTNVDDDLNNIDLESMSAEEMSRNLDKVMKAYKNKK